jgi:hypothetical protein
MCAATVGHSRLDYFTIAGIGTPETDGNHTKITLCLSSLLTRAT